MINVGVPTDGGHVAVMATTQLEQRLALPRGIGARKRSFYIRVLPAITIVAAALVRGDWCYVKKTSNCGRQPD
jgi:hypothetical protein